MGSLNSPTSYTHDTQFSGFRIGRSNSDSDMVKSLRMRFDQLVTWTRILQPHDIQRAFNDGRSQRQGSFHKGFCSWAIVA